ncbi:MAG: KOW domain-containing RNA-binding protein [Clostridium sp.]|uniref:KOW domain-containing RNA-binding protein n=1 Tax=Clostridium culturomicium TaxID=1499683 RepID=UPI00058D6C73|nr:KOW domain-containing RNA-binding protein [Clostridium sp.]MDU7085411.1 KOW domain-containing RNA-binding protein [Clostridium sp.]
MDEHNLLGKVVHSKSGRDKGKYFIIIGIIDAEYVYISDGDLRKIEKPKKKKLKHLGFTNLMADEIREAILSDGRISNSKIRKFLQVEDIIEEV